MMKARLVLAFAAFLLSAGAASACTCVKRTEAELLACSNVVVQGSVVSVRHSSRLGRKTVVARISVQSASEPMARSYINVEAYEQVGQCAVIFKPNEQIRFAALKRGLVYRTNICKIFPLLA